MRPTREDNELISPMMKFEGIWVVDSLPSQPLQIQPFQEGWKDAVNATLTEICGKWDTADFKNDVEAWKSWVRDIAPRSDDVNEYLQDYKERNGSRFTTPLEDLFNLPFNHSIISEIQQHSGISVANAELVMDAQPSVVFHPRGFGPFDRTNIPPRRFRENAVLACNVLVGKLTDENMYGNYESLTAAALQQMLRSRGLDASRKGGKADYIRRLKEADAAELGVDAEFDAELPPPETHPIEGVATSFEYDTDSDIDNDDPGHSETKAPKRRLVQSAVATLKVATVGTKVAKGRGGKPGAGCVSRATNSAPNVQVASGQGSASRGGTGSSPVAAVGTKVAKGRGTKCRVTSKLLPLAEDPSYPMPVNMSSVLFTSRVS